MKNKIEDDFMAIYSFDKINEMVPIEAVLEMHGIYPQGKGSDKSWYSIRSGEKAPSAHIDKQRRYGNTIHDFGIDNTFNPITLTMFLQGLEEKMGPKEAKKEAARILGEYFGIEPEKTEKENADKPVDYVSDWEWKELLIYPDMASKNMLFFPDRFGHTKTREYAEKYRIPMSALKSEDMNMYEKIVKSKGKARVAELRNAYFWKLYNWYNLRQELNIEFNPDDLKNDNEIEESFKELTNAERILEKALAGTAEKFVPDKYDILKDYYKVVNGKVPIEIGQESCIAIQSKARQNNTRVFSTEPLTLDEYYQLVKNGLDNLEHSALKKGEKVVVSFVSTDSSKVNYLVQAMFGKERYVANVLAESALDFKQRALEDKVIDEHGGQIVANANEKNGEITAEAASEKYVSKDIV